MSAFVLWILAPVLAELAAIRAELAILRAECSLLRGELADATRRVDDLQATANNIETQIGVG